jgi:hypothetical protein
MFGNRRPFARIRPIGWGVCVTTLLAGCSGFVGEEPVAGSWAGSFTLQVSPDPVVFQQLFPGAGSLALSSPPPPDPRFYVATMTLIITEEGGGFGHLDSVRTELRSKDGTTVPAGVYDGACDFANELTRGGDRTISPHGRLEWCMGRLATPDPAREYTLLVTARIVDGHGKATNPSTAFRVVFPR